MDDRFGARMTETENEVTIPSLSLTERIIERVKHNDYLYDPKNANYRNQKRREAFWKELGSDLKLEGNEVRKKWKYLKVSYAKYLKSFSSNSNQKRNYQKWQWAKHLEFIRPHLLHMTDECLNEDSMPLQQRLTMAGNKVPQDDSLLAPTLKSQPLSPTKLKVTRHAAAAEEKIETPHTALLEEVCLRWNSHHSNMQTAFPSLLSKEQYCDVTLVADGKSLKCHKLILSSCSSYFDQVLEKIMPYQHPVIFMKDIPFNILKSLCDFMYAGEVNILQSDLDQLLAVGESLKIKGLANRSEPDTVNIPSPKDPVEEVSEAPLSKSTKSTVRPSTSEKKSLPRTKELVDRVTDPLDLMEPTYEEEATPDLPPAVLKRNDQTRKSTGKRVRKRKHVENDHEPSPPIFQTRKGTRSRPNVKVPRYFNASFDNSNDKTAVADTSSEIHQGSEEAMVDPLLDMVEEIKTEPVDIEDGLISYGEESYDMGEEPASTTGLFKKINSASAKLIVTKQEKEDAPDPLNTEQVDDRPKQVEEKGVENNNGEEDASGVIGETQTTLTQENSTTENERAEENAVHENLVENNVQDEEMGQMTTLSIAGTFDAVDQSQESAT